MRYQHTETGEIKSHRDWQNELGMSFHPDHLPEFLIVPEYTAPELTLEQRRERQRQVLKQERIKRTSAPINNVQVATPVQLGACDGAATNWNDAVIGELILTDTVLSNSDREKVEGYLAHKWGLSGSLTSGHPYKSAPPI